MNEDRSAVDPAALDKLLEITGGDPDFVTELVTTYLDDAVEQLRAMRQAIEAGDVGELVRPAHSMKTNSANMGALLLAQMCRELESDARAGTVDRSTERIAAAEAEFALVQVELLRGRDDR